ncbi:RNA-guided pseudouridylation complex pseudouridine synthase subunit Cbf5 [Candidatus Woesearchaeota archaeon]|nr:RNA-guided pseudouridylation complex pseudouridine synthase subunit Cbf5 [Candidatus Woesearchaeota archaeon]
MGLLPFEQEERTVIVRREAPTSDKYGKPPSERTVKELLEFGIIPLDKPPGPTSHQVSAYVQKVLKIRKAGHSGTLDPKVTGVLPVALGRATRVVQSLLTAGKEYITLMHLHKPVEEYKVRKLLSDFLGKITQLPPVKSAVKRQERERTIYYINYLGAIDQDVLFIAGTQAGTYIRKLCHDMGQSVKGEDGKPIGAHMAELRRSKAGPFKEDDGLVTLHDLADAFHYWKEEGKEDAIRKAILPAEEGLAHLKKIWVLDSAVESMCQGVQLKVPGISKLHDNIVPGDVVAVMTLKDEAVLVGEARLTSEQMLGEKGVAVRSQQVFMRPGTYPKNA